MQVVAWVIIGGGLHGVCAARALSKAGASVRILEPRGRLLDRWQARASAVAMTWMRSPAIHHLDGPPSSLHHFLHRPENRDVADLAGPFRLPSYAAFNRHSEDVIAQYGLDQLVEPVRVHSIRSDGDRLLVLGTDQEWRAQRVLLALGSNALRIPSWAEALQREGAPLQHVFDEDETSLHRDLIGGGISAIQRALMVRGITRQTVRLWMRGPLRVHEFDFDWLQAKHKFMGQWIKKGDAERCTLLATRPQGGSVPAKLAERFGRAVRLGQIEVTLGEPQVQWDAAKGRILLRGEAGPVESTGLTLATGFRTETLPTWLQPAVERLGLTCVQGLPRLERDMHWGAGLYVTGPLASLRLGPMANNIVGARWASSLLPGTRLQPV